MYFFGEFGQSDHIGLGLMWTICVKALSLELVDSRHMIPPTYMESESHMLSCGERAWQYLRVEGRGQRH